MLTKGELYFYFSILNGSRLFKEEKFNRHQVSDVILFYLCRFWPHLPSSKLSFYISDPLPASSLSLDTIILCEL